MKNKYLYLFLFIFICLICSPLTSEENEGGKQIIELIGGIFPNSDLNANTYFEVNINYNSFFKSSFLLDIKDHTKRDKSSPDEGETEETIDVNKRTLMELSILEWEIPITKNKHGLNIKLTPGIKCDYIFEEQSYLFQDVWEDDSGVNQLYMEREVIETHALMPMVSSLLDFEFSEFFIMTLGIDILPYGLDWKNYNEFDTTTDPDPIEQQQAFIRGALILFLQALVVDSALFFR